VVDQPLKHQNLSYVMSNNFGFGGNNVSLIFASALPQKDAVYA